VRLFLNLVVLFLALPLLAQSNAGELHLKIIGPDGRPTKASIDLASDAIQFQRSFSADDSGVSVVRNLPFGRYKLTVQEANFAPYTGLIAIHSAFPTEYIVTLSIAAISTAVNVTTESTLLDPERTTTINHLDSKAIAERPASFPGRSLPDLINSQPGWLYEGSAVLHPRGSEYQTQFVVDGIPLTDNRSPGSAPKSKLMRSTRLPSTPPASPPNTAERWAESWKSTLFTTRNLVFTAKPFYPAAASTRPVLSPALRIPGDRTPSGPAPPAT